MKRHEITEKQWNRIKDDLPPEKKPHGGLTTKAHAVTDGLGNPFRFLLSGGNRHNICMAQELLEPFDLNLRKQGKTAAHVHLGGKEYFESRSFYPKYGYREYAPDMMKKEL